MYIVQCIQYRISQLEVCNKVSLSRPFLQEKEAAIDQVVDRVEDVADKLDDYVIDHD